MHLKDTLKTKTVFYSKTLRVRGKEMNSKKERADLTRRLYNEVHSIMPVLESCAKELEFYTPAVGLISRARKLAKEIIDDALLGSEDATIKLRILEGIQDILEYQSKHDQIIEIELSTVSELLVKLRTLHSMIGNIISQLEDTEAQQKPWDIYRGVAKNVWNIDASIKSKGFLDTEERKALTDIAAQVEHLLNLGPDGLKRHIESTD